MSAPFDPYYKWLAIPPKDQPPNYYRLLAVEPFEADRDVIATAADQRMMLVRSFHSGENYRISQRVLNEIAAAKLCLLDPARKSAYDDRLRQSLSATGPSGVVQTSPGSPGGAVQRPSGAPGAILRANDGLPDRRRTARYVSWLPVAIAGGIGAVVLAALLATLSGRQGGRDAATGDATNRLRSSSAAAAKSTAPPSAKQDVGSVVVSPATPHTPRGPLRLREVAPQRVAHDAPLRLALELDTHDPAPTSLQYFLGPGAPPGVTIDKLTGLLTWLPGGARVPGQYTIEAIASDGGQQAAIPISVTVEQGDAPPRIRPVADQTVAPGATLRFAVAPIDVDQSSRRLRYELLSGPPGATLDPERGEFAWSPAAAAAGQTFEARIRVVDRLGGQAETRAMIHVEQQVAATSEPSKSGPQAKQNGRMPVPAPADQNKASLQVQQLFREDLAKARQDRAARLKLAERLIREAENTRDDAAGRYVLYKEAAAQALLAGDAASYVKAIDALARRYDIDALDQKQQGLVELSKTARSDDAALELAQALLTLVDESIQQDELDRAVTLGRIALAAAIRSRDVELRKQVVQRNHEVAVLKKLLAETQRSRDLLTQESDNAAANRIVGTYEALVKANWARGLPLLAKGDDDTLAGAARKELSQPTEAAAKREVADAWAVLVLDKHPTGTVARLFDSVSLTRNNVREHALKWYEAALPGLTGLSKRSAEQQIAQLRAATDGPSGRSASKDSLTALRKTYRFYAAGPFALSGYPRNPKWIKASNNVQGSVNNWYVITDDGHLRAYKGGTGAATVYGPSLANVGPNVYNNPALLCETGENSRGGR